MDLLSSVPKWEVCRIVNVAELSRFETLRVNLQVHFKERLSIDKSCAGFLKAATRKYDIGEVELPAIRPIDAKGMYMISVMCDIDVPDETGTRYAFQPTEKIWNPTISIPKVVLESEVFPKEVLQITSTTSTFIRSCLKAELTLDGPFDLLEENEHKKYYVESQSRIPNEGPHEPYHKMPNAIEVPKTFDAEYLEEAIETKGDFTWDFKVKDDVVIPLLKEFDFIIPVLASKTITTADNLPLLKISKWEMSLPKSLKTESLSTLERFLIEEELERGVEYRLRAPYMDDSPVFSEPKEPFDLIDVYLRFPPHKPATLKNGSLSDIVKDVDEELLLFETIEGFELEVPVIDDAMGIIGEDKPYLVEIVSSKTEAVAIGQEEETLQFKPQSPSPLLEVVVTTPEVTCLQDSHININKTELDQNKTTKSDIDTTLNATKMFTTYRDMTDKSLTKRSLDDDLDELILQKRKRLSETQAQRRDKLTLPFVDLLLSNSAYAKDHEPVVEEFIIDETLSQTDSKNLQLFPKTRCDNLLIFNSSLTSIPMNHKLLKQLDRKTSLDIFEIELVENDVDFVLSPRDGVLIFDYQRCQQIDQNGYLVIQERVLFNKMRYKNLYAIITCSSLESAENLLYIQTCLSILDVAVITTTDNLENLSEWIQLLCQLCDVKRDTDDNLEEISPSINFLLQCGVNILSAYRISKQVPLTDFITMSLKERISQFGSLLPSAQIEYHDVLFNTNWSIDT